MSEEYITLIGSVSCKTSGVKRVRPEPVQGSGVDYQQLSDLERAKIEIDIKNDLVMHFCRSTRSGIIAGGLSSCVAFSLVYSSAKFALFASTTI